MTDQNRDIVWQADYNPFGEATITTGTVENNLRFPGQYLDGETNLHYNYFRYYDLRVAERVTHGGYNIPVQDIERRFPRSLKNLFAEFSALVDSTICFMNTDETPELIFEQQGTSRNIVHNDYYQQLLKQARL